MKETNTLIVGASIAGLASASTLQKRNIECLIIEKESQVATPWRKHYDRLHLHTSKGLSNLPYKKFDRSVARYPSRQQVVDYLVDYQRAFNINPLLNTEATSIKKQGDRWIIETNNGVYKSKYAIIATGPFGKPKPISFK